MRLLVSHTQEEGQQAEDLGWGESSGQFGPKGGRCRRARAEEWLVAMREKAARRGCGEDADGAEETLQDPWDPGQGCQQRGLQGADGGSRR